MVKVLGFGNVCYVGGVVCDMLMGLLVKDIDMVMMLLLIEVMVWFDKVYIGYVFIGIVYGIVIVILCEGLVEIIMLCYDVLIDGCCVMVVFVEDWCEDVVWCDFMINVFYVDLVSLELFDWFGGFVDFVVWCVWFIGDVC